MRRSLALILLAIGCASEQPAPVVAPHLPARADSPGGAARALQVVAMRWEDQPALADDAGVKPDGAPVSLTAGDGTGLEITSLSATAVVEDPLAFTELHFVFKNPQPRPIEGRFEITLPPNATISRFAMRQSDGFQEGEVVELKAAREAYEDFLHHRADPALLEKQSGNSFQARVFPIPASGEKEIIFSYSQELTRSKDPYRLYLHGLPRLGRLDLRVLYDKREDDKTPLGRRSFEIHQTNFTPDHDFALPLPAAATGARGLRQDRLAVGRITPLTEAAPDPMTGLFVLFDTSASRALGFHAEVDRLKRLVDALRKDAGADLPLVVACFDQDVEVIHDGTADELGQKHLDAILARRPLGASDLGKALRFAASFTPRSHAKLQRALLLTDGIVTAGEAEAADLKAEIARLRKAGVERIDAIVGGGIRDESLLSDLTVGGLAKDGIVVDGALAPAQIAARLTRRAVSGIKVDVPGSAWVWPPVLNGVQPGEQAVIYADIPQDKPFEVVLGGAVKGARQTIETRGVERPMIERAMVNAEIRRLADMRGASADERARERYKQQIIDLSTKYRVLSDFTGLLILETDQDYARFNINRRALAEILTVGPAGVDLLDRNKQNAPMQVAAAAPPEMEENEAPRKKRDSGESEDKKSSREPPPAQAAAAPPPPPPPALDAPPPSGGAPPSDPRGPMATSAPRAAPPPAPPSPKPDMMEEKPKKPAPSGANRGAPRVSRFDADDEERPSSRPSASTPAPRPRSTPSPGLVDPWVARPRPPISRPPPSRPAQQVAEEEEQQGAPPYEGKFRDVMDLLEKKRAKDALALALPWQESAPGDALALVALGEAYEALGQKSAAARAYGSIIDLFPSRADLRRFAGARLERLGAGQDGALDLVIDTYRHAVASRPDHPASHRLLAFALLRAGKPEEAFKAIFAGASRGYPSGRFASADRILRDDAGLIAAAWIRAEPAKKSSIVAQAAKVFAAVPTQPSLRFVLTWETDANDVDFHILDSAGGHAFYQDRELPSGGELYDDVTTGYGPECFTIEGRPRAYPYRLMAHYFSRGPMGYGMGKVEVIEHDGKGGLKFDERPFVVMTDRAFVKLGTVSGPLPAPR